MPQPLNDNPSSLLDSQTIMDSLSKTFISHVIYKQQTQSTNDDVKVFFDQNVAEGLVVLADQQLKGRGRQGSWDDCLGDMILMSVLLRRCPLKDHYWLTMIAAIAVCVKCWPLYGWLKRVIF